MKVCSIDGCAKKSEKRTWCGMHYRRWLVHGDVNALKKRANGDGFIHCGYLAKQADGVKKFEHVRIAEEALGKPLPENAVVHHVNEIKLDNRNENLVICQDRAYHNLIHARTNAYKATGDANAKRCVFCKTYDIAENLSQYRTQKIMWHPECNKKNYTNRNKPKGNQL